MSFADFNQHAEDHTRILILVLQAGSRIRPRTFSKIYDRIARLNTLTVLTGPPRLVRLRYRKYYAIENNAWGDFQVHRRVMGLITVGQCEHESDVLELFRQYEQLKEKYESTLLDSRLVILGDVKPSVYANGSLSSSRDSVSIATAADHKQNSPTSTTSSSETTPSSEDSVVTFIDPLHAAAAQSLSDSNDSVYHSLDSESIGSFQPGNGGSPEINASSAAAANLSLSVTTRHVLRYPSEDDCTDLESRVQEFLESLFWVLESKRLDRSHERLDHLMLLTAPFEQRKDSSAGDVDSRIYKKRCQGRQKKHLGDLCLLAGVPGDSLLHYQTSVDLLRATNDHLWLAGAYEGLASASVVLLQPRPTKSLAISRNLSFSLKRGLGAAKQAKLKSGGSSTHSMSTSLQLTPNGLDLATDGHTELSLPAGLPEDILDNYKEAVIYYSKFKDAGVIEMEASLKACRVLITHQRILAAADFLQNVVYINVQLMEEEKVQRFLTLADLYAQLRMFRKAAFYSRIAAMQCVAPANPQQLWLQCYQLLIQALPGYRLSLDPKEIPREGPTGWVSVQLRVLHELVYSARRMGNPSIAIRHLSFLLHAMFDSLTTAERNDLAGVLRSYTNKCEGTALSIALDDGTILSPVPFIRFPTLRSLKLQQLVPHHRPVKIDRQATPSGAAVFVSPFIYSPLQLSPAHEAAANKKLRDVFWVEGDVCEISLTFYNPLPFEINISNLGLMVEGVEVSCISTNVVLGPESGPVPTKLQVVAKQSGQLNILGYTTLVMGVKNHCRLREIHHPVDLCTVATVVPALPLVQVTTSLPRSSNFSTLADSDCVVANVALTVLAGQSSKFELKLLNVGKLPVERIDLITSSSLNTVLLHELLQWDEDQLNSQLPLDPGGNAVVVVTVTALSDFLSRDVTQRHLEESTESNPVSRFSELRRCTMDTASASATVETLLTVKYSGGAGLDAGFCRQASVSLTVDILCSLLVSDWSATAGDRANTRCINVDIFNTMSDTVQVFNVCENQLRSSDSDDDGCQLTIKSHCTARFSAIIPAPAEQSDCSASTMSRYISEFVDIRWKTLSSGAEGRLGLDAVDWTLSRCSALRYSHISWSVEAECRSFPPGDATDVRCFEPINVSCSVSNCSDVELTDVDLEVMSVTMTTHPDAGSDVHSSDASNISNHVVIIGCTKSFSSQVRANESFSLACSLLFTSPGISDVTFCCRATIPSSDSSSPADSPTESRVWCHLVTLRLTEPAGSPADGTDDAS